MWLLGLEETRERFLEGDVYLLCAIALVCIVAGIASPYFWSFDNFSNVLSQASIPLFLSVGATIVIGTGRIDLSVGSIVALSGLAAASLSNATANISAGVLFGALTGVACGLLNGVLSGVMPSFIATLATMAVFRGLALVLTGSGSVGLNFAFVDPQPLGITVLLSPSLIFLFIIHLILRRTRYGLTLLACGSNARAAENAGLNVKVITGTAMILNGLAAGMAGVCLMLRLGGAVPTAGAGYELDAIAASIIGGAVLTGGKVNLVGTFFATMLFSIIRNGLALANIAPELQQVLLGSILAGVVAAQLTAERKRQESR